MKSVALLKLTFPELPVHLAAEYVEEIGRGGHVGDLHVAILVLTIKGVLGREYTRIFVAQLEISLHPSGRMLWTLTIIAVRE